jgi:hypothetical protein
MLPTANHCQLADADAPTRLHIFLMFVWCLPQVEVGVQLQTKPGQNVVLVGSHPSLGSWSLDGALPMTWSEGHVWKASIELPADSMDLEYKVRPAAVKASAATQWQWARNRTHAQVLVHVDAIVNLQRRQLPLQHQHQPCRLSSVL